MRTTNPYISIVINCDTRPQKDTADGLFSGTTNLDYLDEGVFQKQRFFSGFDIETICFIDEHIPVPEKTLEYLRSVVDVLVIRKHTGEEKFNDWNYWSALALARGKYICHFDQDSNAFSSSKESVEEMINLLEDYSFISYPSHWTPNPVHDDNYDYRWCSTRFFLCKRETLDFTEIKKCLEDMDYLYGKYPASVRNPWMEHILGLLAKYNGKEVCYPTIDPNKLIIFSWGRYEQWTLKRLNEYTYDQMKEWLNSHPIFYPNDCFA